MSIPKEFIKKLKKNVAEISIESPSKNKVTKDLKSLYIKYITTEKVNKSLYYNAAIKLIIYKALITNVYTTKRRIYNS